MKKRNFTKKIENRQTGRPENSLTPAGLAAKFNFEHILGK